MTRSTVLVLGAAGRFGAAAVQAFAAAGWRVLAQARRAPAQSLPAGATALQMDLADAGAIDALVAAGAGSAVVVYAVNPLYTRWDAELMPLARHGMTVAERLGARFMLPGNIYNFGTAMPATLDEQTPQLATTPKGRQRIAMELELKARCEAGALHGTVIRAGDFYGVGTGTWLDQLIVKSARSGKLVYPGPLDVPHAWAYLPDLARAFVAVASQRHRPAFEQLHFEGHTLDGRQLLTLIEGTLDALGDAPKRSWRRGAMPWGLVRAVGLVHPMWRELARMSYLWRVPHALNGGALHRAVGPLVSTPPAAAMRATMLGLGFGATLNADADADADNCRAP